MGNFLSGRRPETVTPNIGTGVSAEPPKWLATELHEYWRVVVTMLPTGTAMRYDERLIGQLCEALFVQDAAWSAIATNGIEETDTAHNNEKRRNPAIITWRQAADMARQCMSLLGMSPVSRARIQADSDPGANEFMRYLQRRNGTSE